MKIDWKFNTAGRESFFAFSNQNRRAKKIMDNGRDYEQVFGATHLSPTGSTRFSLNIVHTTHQDDIAITIGVALDSSTLK